jgi:phosphoribosyl-ATP pyrophosphohydrolase
MAKPKITKPAAPAKPGKATKSAKPTKPAKARATAVQVARKAVTSPAARNPVPMPASAGADVLDHLYQVVLSRRDADPATSHSARLLSRGPMKVAQKFGEEAVECLLEAAAGDQAALVLESADVLYHLLVVWVSVGIAPAEVWAELERRTGVSGIAEKASRPRLMLGTTKIP